MRSDELMKSDLLSEVVLTIVATVVLLGLIAWIAVLNH